MRRQRRGLTLVEAVVTIMLSAIAVLVLTTLVDSVSRTTILQSEARALSRAADDAVRAARSDLDAHIAAAQGSVIRIGAGDITGLTPSLLTDSTPVTATTPYGHTIQFAHFAPDPDTLLVLTWTTETLAGVQGIAIPRVRPGGGIRRVGRAGGITADLRCPADHWCGVGINWDTARFTAAAGTLAPAAGALVAIRDISLAREPTQLLWRTRNAPRHLSRMDTVMQVSGTIVNVDQVVAPRTIAGIGTLTITPAIPPGSPAGTAAQGNLTTASLTVGQDLTVGGDLDGAGQIIGAGTAIGTEDFGFGFFDIAGDAGFSTARIRSLDSVPVGGNVHVTGNVNFDTTDVREGHGGTLAARAGTGQNLGQVKTDAGGPSLRQVTAASVQADHTAIRKGCAGDLADPRDADSACTHMSGAQAIIRGDAAAAQLATHDADISGGITVNGWMFVNEWCNGCAAPSTP
ncbi:MAG: type II secretion system protein [Rhodobacteraceae bacterium]|nr:type II secretion system protein [Paracoccaceae bacterium]